MEPMGGVRERPGMVATLIVVALGLVVIGAIAVRNADRYVPVLADWYVEMAVTGNSASPAHFAALSAGPGDEEEAYVACAKQVVKRLGGTDAIALFAPPAIAAVAHLVDGGYEIRSHVDEIVPHTSSRRSYFRCTVRPSEVGWKVEDVEVELAPLSLSQRLASVELHRLGLVSGFRGR